MTKGLDQSWYSGVGDGHVGDGHRGLGEGVGEGGDEGRGGLQLRQLHLQKLVHILPSLSSCCL